MNGRDALIELAKGKKDIQPWKNLSTEDQAVLMTQLANHKAEKSLVRTGDKTVAHDIEGSLDCLNREVSSHL